MIHHRTVFNARLMIVTGVALGTLALQSALAAEEAGQKDSQAAGVNADAADPALEVSRSESHYALPPIRLVRDDGRDVMLSDELNDGRPVVLNFIYTTCPGICPLASHVFSELQRNLGTERNKVHLISISIDPEEDTPARLRAYAKTYSAGPSWQHYTGTVAASLAAQHAFDVYRGDKMGHTPVTLLRTAPGAPWVRFDGFATADMLLKELHGHPQVAAAPRPAKP